MNTADNLFLLSVNMLAGSLVVLLFLIGHVWYFTKDKIIGIYGICLIPCFCLVVLKLITLANDAQHTNLMENNLLDELTKSIVGLVYIYFFGVVFEFNIPGKRQIFFWKTAMALMSLQIMYLLYGAFKGVTNYFHPVISPILLSAISLVALLLVVFAFLIKNKSRFQKIVLAGVMVFYILVLVGNLSEYFFKTGKSGFNMLFFALIVENIFFTIASAERIRDIYQKATQLKLSSYQHQLEIEKVTGFFTATIHQHDDTDKLLWNVAKNLIGKLGFEECMIYLWNSDKTILIQRAGYGLKGDMQVVKNKEGYNIPKGKGIVGAVAESGNYILVNDTSKDSRYFSADEKIMFSELSVPLLQNGNVIGVINTEHSKKKFFTDKHVKMLSIIASLCADKMGKIKAEEQAHEKQVEVLKLNQELATSQLTTLRAQMNPHFIFNALNSVQQYILKGDITEANRYLSKFSRLQRQVLNHSSQDFIPLETELEILNLYVELEQLRFEGSFNCSITVGDDIDADEIKIPPMIVQPFVENAIWHGLMPKQGERNLDITFKLLADDLLQCTIKDNGIGREAAARIKSNTPPQHTSKGLSLVYDRLAILRQQYGQVFDVQINDIKNSNSLPGGTEIILHIYTA